MLPTLEYSTPPVDPDADERKERVREALGSVGSGIAMLILLACWIGASIEFDAGPAPLLPRYQAPLTLAALIFVLLCGLALLELIRHRTGAFFRGILFGIGITVIFSCLVFLIFI
jgi:hypothetical protein